MIGTRALLAAVVLLPLAASAQDDAAVEAAIERRTERVLDRLTQAADLNPEQRATLRGVLVEHEGASAPPRSAQPWRRC